MRIITGIARGTKLETLDSDATRPTSDKVKEAIFSMIQFEIEGRRVLDLFGGSGQLALEALSRGAARATIIDESREAVNIIINNAKHAKLYDKCRISAISYSAFLKSFNEDVSHRLALAEDNILKKCTENECDNENACVTKGYALDCNTSKCVSDKEDAEYTHEDE